MTDVQMPKRYLTLKQVLDERPWLTERWLRRAVQMRWIPYYKLGAKLIFDLAEIDHYLEERRVDAVDPNVPAATPHPPTAAPRRRTRRTKGTAATR